VVDTHFTPTMSKANLACIIKPDSGNILGMALMKALLDKENFFGSLIKEKFSDAESWRKSFDIMSLDTALRVCGIEEQTILELAGFLTKLQPCQLITGKKLAYMAGYGIWRTLAEAVDLPTVEGGGWYPLDSGRPPIDVTKDIESQNRQFSKNQIFGYPYLKNLFTTSSNGADYPIKAVICSGNCIDDYFASLERFSRELDITAYLGAFQNRTSSFANIIFPSALWPERDDLFFTNDRAIHLAKRITKPDYETRSGLDFWMGLAQRLGFGDHFPWKTPQNDSDSEAFHDWILAQSPLTEYCTKRLFDSELDKSSLITWPCRIEDLEEARRTKDLHNLGELRHKLRIGSERSHEAIESFRGKSLIPAPALSSNELSNLEQDDLQKFPLYVEAPSTICQTMTVDFTRPNFYQEPGVYYLRINPEMAQALGIFTGDIVKIEGQGMILEAVALLSRAMPRWLIHLNSPIGEGRVLVYRKGGSSESALSIIGKMLSNK
ncbi:MAG: molybdopterin-dependent oxidoreductase, partial [Desulfomonilaceae bacterium]